MGIEWIVISLYFMLVRPGTVFVRNCTTIQYVTVRRRDINRQQTTFNIIFVNLEYGHFGFIFYLRSQVISTDVPCVIEKRELLVLLHTPYEMRYCHNVGYCICNIGQLKYVIKKM
jgi:hypothetical protein